MTDTMEIKASILVVDDNDGLCDGIREFLEEEGYTVDCAHNGKDAIGLSSTNRYDIALVDIELLDIQGTELVKNMAGISPSTEFIHITAHASLDSAIEAVRHEHIVSYETKPLDMYHLLSVLKQIMKRKKMEEALFQSEKLKSIGTITAGIAHEFNNILAIIFGNVQLLEETYKDHGELIGGLRIIGNAAKDGAEISNKMLTFTKRNEDTTDYSFMELVELLKEAIDFTMPRWKNMAQAKGVNYSMDMEGIRNSYYLMCNPTEIREVFVNIINNALDAMPGGGCISFSTWREDDTVFLSISDNGEGMPEEVKKNIFDPFFTTKLAIGTGLGMSTSYGIMSKHRGKIVVKSEEGKGSTFILQFPVTDRTDISKKISETELKVKNNNLRILVVDDNKDICKILEKFFTRKGLLARIVDNGKEAIMLAKVDDYDLVLCDLAMPEVYGYDVIKALNELRKRPRIAVLTGWNEKFISTKDDDLEIDFIVKKPFVFSELTRIINNVLDTI